MHQQLQEIKQTRTVEEVQEDRGPLRVIPRGVTMTVPLRELVTEAQPFYVTAYTDTSVNSEFSVADA